MKITYILSAPNSPIKRYIEEVTTVKDVNQAFERCILKYKIENNLDNTEDIQHSIEIIGEEGKNNV